MKILVVDDDLELSGLIAFALRRAGYLTVEAADGRTALEVHAKELPDLVILDYNLPGLDGVEVLERLRAGGDKTPVMMLTVRADEEDQVRALDCGADDYLTKPFSPRTLLARVRALLRRAGVEKPSSLAAGDLSLDSESQRVTVGEREPVSLTRLEYRLMQLLITNAGHPLPADRLTSHVWGYRGVGDRQLLKQLVHRLRQKIEADVANPGYLITVPGVGYLLQPRPESGEPDSC